MSTNVTRDRIRVRIAQAMSETPQAPGETSWDMVLCPLSRDAALIGLADDREFLARYEWQVGYSPYPGAARHATERIPMLRARISRAELVLRVLAAEAGGSR